MIKSTTCINMLIISKAHLNFYKNSWLPNNVLFHRRQMRVVVSALYSSVATKSTSEACFLGTKSLLTLSKKKLDLSTFTKPRQKDTYKYWKMLQTVPSRSQQSTGISVPSLLNEMLRTKQVIQHDRKKIPTKKVPTRKNL
jgi:hypothetical protein